MARALGRGFRRLGLRHPAGSLHGGQYRNHNLDAIQRRQITRGGPNFKTRQNQAGTTSCATRVNHHTRAAQLPYPT
jgi:hypothetical protein